MAHGHSTSTRTAELENITGWKRSHERRKWSGNSVFCCACRKANNRESARRTRAKKSNKMAELEEENSRLRAQLQAAEQQAEELKLLLQSLPQIGQHQR